MQSAEHTQVTQEKRGAVCILWIDNPPVNALGHRLRLGLAEGLARANADHSVRSIAILAKGRSFPAGADISEFGKPPQDPLLPDLCVQIEDSAKPVVAGLHGFALGGGLELALAAHARVAVADTKLGLPEVTLGILPGAGGTQRLPRLIGAAEALRLMLSGRPINAAEALALGILDKVVEQDLTEATVTMAMHLGGEVPVRTADRLDGFRDPKAYFAEIASARAAHAGSALPGPGRIIDCVEAARLLPFDQGLAFERAAFAELVATPEAEALRHVFFAERRARQMVGAKAKPRAVSQVTVLGHGVDAVALCKDLLRADYDVTLVERETEALTKGLEAIAVSLAAEVTAGKLTQAAHDALWAKLSPGLPGEDDDAADMLFLTGAYRMPGADVPSVSAAIGAPIVTMGRVGEGGQRGLGLVLMPATRNGRMAEVLIGQNTAPEAIASLLSVLNRLGRTVIQGQGTGVNAGLSTVFQASLQALEAKHGPEPVLELLGRWDMLRDKDRHGPVPDGPQNLFGGLAAPVLGALANAGLRMIGEERALRPSDVDLAFILGHGFPRHGGGPMLWASRRGLIVLRDDLNRWADDAPDIWTPAPLLNDLIRQGISLNDLNEA